MICGNVFTESLPSNGYTHNNTHTDCNVHRYSVRQADRLPVGDKITLRAEKPLTNIHIEIKSKRSHEASLHVIGLLGLVAGAFDISSPDGLGGGEVSLYALLQDLLQVNLSVLCALLAQKDCRNALTPHIPITPIILRLNK
jgi:hypothetical protein